MLRLFATPKTTPIFPAKTCWVIDEKIPRFNPLQKAQLGTRRSTGSAHGHRCYEMASSVLQGDPAAVPRAPNWTTRRAGLGLPQVASTLYAMLTRRRCYKTTWSLLQGELTLTTVFRRGRNWGHGHR